MYHPCVLWQGPIEKRTGRAKASSGGNAARDVWEEAYGPIPKGSLVRHLCDNPSCINLRHLRLGSRKDNCQDRASSKNIISPTTILSRAGRRALRDLRR